MRVRDIMNVKPVTVQAEASVSQAAAILRENKISGLPVLDGERLVGIVSESDLLRLLSVDEEEGGLWLPSPFEIFEVPFRDLVKWERMRSALDEIPKKKVSGVMSRNLHEVGPDDSIEEAAGIMTRHRINRLPVVEDGRLVGIVTRGDIISGLGMRHEED
ncbi:MAG: CBS domain-containing protein [Methanothrix sp.]|jgi:CBS domain-containing protein|nr:CBS domain-containing protein [Methanothrix sp.]HNQ55142.1 CBS domain-containing protein [Methanothrix sp.]HNU39467.1 CBS domain-containing protein [Methanothrix sp.]HPA97297.1 CBS domain-containing protein [Methanothrix sp.]HPM26592.1 CBS domain-containing protein [Methanothrix sp.]